MITWHLEGIFALFIFVVLGGIGLLLIVAGLIIKLAGNQNWFLKCARASFVFFISGLSGFVITVFIKDNEILKILDEQISWIVLSVDVILATLIFLKKAPKNQIIKT